MLPAAHRTLLAPVSVGSQNFTLPIHVVSGVQRKFSAHYCSVSLLDCCFHCRSGSLILFWSHACQLPPAAWQCWHPHPAAASRYNLTFHQQGVIPKGGALFNGATRHSCAGTPNSYAVMNPHICETKQQPKKSESKPQSKSESKPESESKSK
jgi:hypothetical protein